MNPALTAIANALRVGDHLLERLGVPASDAASEPRQPSPASPASPARASMPDAMAGRAEVAAVYGAALIQGVALVTFPAASSILTSPSDYGLTSTAYGALFLPQAIAAIAAALAGARLTRRSGVKRVFLAGLVGDLAAMALLVAQPVRHRGRRRCRT